MRARGFTLIEVLIAMAITAVMAVMTIGSLRQVDRASEIAREQGGALRRGAPRAHAALARAVDGVPLGATTTDAATASRPTLFVGREDELLFTTSRTRAALPRREGVGPVGGRVRARRGSGAPRRAGALPPREAAHRRRAGPRRAEGPRRRPRHLAPAPVLGPEAERVGAGVDDALASSTRRSSRRACASSSR